MEMPFHAVWAVFQPFTYSRTAVLLDDFAKALSIPTHAVLTDIMGSREKNTYNIFTRQLGEKFQGLFGFHRMKLTQNPMMNANTRTLRMSASMSATTLNQVIWSSLWAVVTSTKSTR